MKLRKVGFFTGLLSALAGCGLDAPDVTKVMAHGDCKRLNAGVSEVAFEDLARIRGSQLLMLEQAEAADAQPSPAPDFRLVAVSIGAQPTPGYELELSDARFEDGTLVLAVALNEPPSGVRLTHVTSHPCLIVATSHRRIPIEVRNQDGVLGILQPVAELLDEPTGEPSGQ